MSRDARLVSPGPEALAIGERFRAARVGHDLSLADAAERLGLPPKDLRAIEWGRFDLLPSARYARKCVRRYAAFLGLDAKAYVAEHAWSERTGDLRRARRRAARARLGSGALLAAIVPGALIVAIVWYFGAGS